MAAFDELVRYYFTDPAYTLEAPPFGLTNLTAIITINDEKYVARIYNRHTKNIPSIELEARVTAFLNHNKLSFRVPAFLRTPAGDEYVQLSDGALGAIVTFLEGKAPELLELEQAAEFGRVIGEISSVLGNYETEQLSYHGQAFSDLYRLHPLADRQAVTAFIEQPPFSINEVHLALYKEMAATVENKLDQLKELPSQLVHHDLLIFNLLSQDDKICGVLDFDFISLDARFMEFAISLNHILQLSNGSLEMTEAFIKGYAEYCQSSPEEIALLQLLTQIYHLAVLHIYIGQHYSGMNIESNFTYILHQFHTRNNWLNEHHSFIQQLLTVSASYEQ